MGPLLSTTSVCWSRTWSRHSEGNSGGTPSRRSRATDRSASLIAIPAGPIYAMCALLLEGGLPSPELLQIVWHGEHRPPLGGLHDIAFGIESALGPRIQHLGSAGVRIDEPVLDDVDESVLVGTEPRDLNGMLFEYGTDRSANGDLGDGSPLRSGSTAAAAPATGSSADVACGATRPGNRCGHGALGDCRAPVSRRPRAKSLSERQNRGCRGAG